MECIDKLNIIILKKATSCRGLLIITIRNQCNGYSGLFCNIYENNILNVTLISFLLTVTGFGNVFSG